MSLMAGFDFVAEVSRGALLDLLKTAFVIQGQPCNPPFELELPLASGNASAHLIVSGIDLELSDDDRATISFDFANSSVSGDSPSLALSELGGAVAITAPVSLAPTLADPTISDLAFDMEAAEIDLAYTTPDSTIGSQLAGSGITVSQFKTISQEAVAALFNAMDLARFPGVAYRIVPATQGSLNPLQFVRLEVHCIGSDDPGKQALGFFGILRLANSSQGDDTAKTATAITPGSSPDFPHEIAISVSPTIYHDLLFCPAMADTLEVDATNDLPMSCGFAFGVETDEGVKLHWLFDEFADGHVNLDGLFSKSGPCYEATGSFHGEITFTAGGTAVTPHVQMDEPEVDVEFDWYCGPIGGIAIGLEALANLALVNAVAESIAQGFADDAVKKMAGGIGPQQLGGLANVNFDQAVVTTEGLTLVGGIPMFVPVAATPDLDITGSVTTKQKMWVSSGVFEWGIPGFCPPREFEYSEVAQSQVGLFQAQPTLLGLPLELEWSILAGGTIPLPGKSGTVSFPMHTHYALPLDSGGTSLTQTIHVDYAIEGDTITLENVASEGNYAFTLQCKATDPTGQVETEVQYVVFEGSAVVFEEGYEAYVNECTAKFRKFLAGIADAYSGSDSLVPPWVPIDRPPEEVVIQQFLRVARLPAARSDVMLARLATAHGSSWVRALLAARHGRLESVKGQIGDPTAG